MSRARCVWAALLVVALALSLGATTAHAGQWIQVSCVNPDGSAANGEGWTASGTPSQGGSSISDPQTCSPADPISAVLAGTYSAITGLTFDYVPPTGSLLTGATLNGTLTAEGEDGFGVIYSPSAAGTRQAQCFASDCQTLSGPWSWKLPAVSGNDIEVQAACDLGEGGQCVNGANGTVATAEVTSADISLQNNASPTGTGFSGTALGTVGGTGQLLFTASESDGPGIYTVTTAIDGTTVYSATPSTNGGSCAPVGSQGGVLMFDGTQPCPTSESVDAPVPTTSFSNGTHILTATVTDAAGNSTTVFARSITVDNPVAPAPAPTVLKKIHEKALFSWDYRRPVTRLRSVRLARQAHLPAGARISVGCEPAKLCPKRLPAKSVGVKQLARLFDALKGVQFKPGAVFQLTIAAPHRRAERFVWKVRSRRIPVGHVRAGVKALPTPPTSATTKQKDRKRS